MNRRNQEKNEVDSLQTCTHENKDFQAQAYRRLEAAILLQAIWDTTHFDPLISEPARWWLAYDGWLYCQVLGLDPAVLQGWIEAGCSGVQAPVG